MIASAGVASRSSRWWRALALAAAFAAAALSPLPAQAASPTITPQNGYWWNPAEGGRGYFIEIQGNTLFMAAFLYAADGESTWLASNGPMSSSTQYTGSLITYTDGQTLTGNYQTPVESPPVGTVSLTFTANNQGTLTWPGGTEPIQRFDIVPGGSSATAPATAPQTGWWYDPDQGGRGFAFEVQNGAVYLAGYMYDAAGNPTWYLSSGTYANSVFQSTWQKYQGGQTLTGAWKPAGFASGDAGNVTLQFSDPTHATITMPNGQQIPFSRFPFAALPVNPIPADLWSPPAGSTPAGGNYVYLAGQAGDYISGGATYTYTTQNSVIALVASGDSLSLNVTGDQTWNGNFLAMNVIPQLQVGYYPNLTRFPFENPAVGGLTWSGEGRGCNTLTGWFAVDNVVYTAGVMTALDMRFEQHCEGAGPALDGAVHWTINNAGAITAPTTPTTPTTPTPPNNPVPPSIPAGLWMPPTGSTPASGNYIYLTGQSGDYVFGGQTATYTQANAVVSVNANGGLLAVGVTGNDNWTGDFQTMNTISQLQVGYYAGLQRYPFNNPTAGGLTWYGDGRGCNTSSGWFVVDAVSYSGSTLTSLDLRFEQHCEGAGPALNGKIHWNANDTTAPPGPQAIPAGLWQAPAGSTPASGNYVYLTGQAGDYIVGANTFTYTQANATLQIAGSAGLLTVGVTGNDNWTGDFQAMNTVSQLQVGYYPNLERYPFNNPAAGGLSWYGDGRGCNTLTGWFVVDAITYSGSNLTSIDLRFEQHCEGAGPAMNGQIHWNVNDATAPPGPQSIPAGLWQAPAGSTPASGNYVYLTGQSGDYVVGANTLIYTQANATLQITGSAGLLAVGITGNDNWTGDFQTMNTISQLQVGYYPSLERYPFNNPATGGLSWSGDGRGCNTLTGWFVVDAVTYSGSTLTSIDLRFEQHCEGAGPAMNGKIHWNVNDVTAPPGPVFPVPAGLWAPAAGSTPTSGSYVYLVSDTGDYIGQGLTTTYQNPADAITLTLSGDLLAVSVDGPSGWVGDFLAMNAISQLQAGYYAGLERYPFSNPTAGGLTWYGEGRGCNMLTGWFAIDSISVTGSILNSLDLRFEQHCEGGSTALHGQIHWIGH